MYQILCLGGFVDGPGFEETLPGGVGTSVNYVSFLLVDGVSCGMGVLCKADVYS